jgi:hypothetical protein
MNLSPAYPSNYTLEGIKNQIKSIIKKGGCVMATFLPFDYFTVIHGVFLEKLKLFSNLGINSVIVFLDQFRHESENIELNLVGNIVLSNISEFIERGLPQDKSFFLMESHIWASEGYFEKFSKVFYNLASRSASKRFPTPLLEYLLEISYSAIVLPDIMLTGEKGKEPLRNIVEYLTEKGRVFSNSRAPIILSHPMMRGLNGGSVTIEKGENTLHTGQGAEKRLQLIKSATPEFLIDLCRYLLIPYFDRIQIGEAFYSNINDIEEDLKSGKITEEVFREYISNYTNHYFKKRS